MKTLKYIFGNFCFAFALMGALIANGALLGQGQEEKEESKSSTTRRSDAGRDPFKKYEPPRVVRKVGQLVVPSIHERIAQYKAQKLAAMRARMPAPKPTTALLISEVQVVGISRTPRGYAAIVEATPIKLSYVIYPGERLYDGMLVAIEDNRLVFRRETLFSDGRRERSVEIKPLRQPNSVDVMSSAKVNPSLTSITESDKKPDDRAASDGKPQ